jgi:ankyrin repeat protein
MLTEFDPWSLRYHDEISAQAVPPLMTVVSSGALVNSSGHTLLSLAAISGCAQSVVNCFDAGNRAAQRDYDGQHALQLALMCVTNDSANVW